MAAISTNVATVSTIPNRRALVTAVRQLHHFQPDEWPVMITSAVFNTSIASCADFVAPVNIPNTFVTPAMAGFSIDHRADDRDDEPSRTWPAVTTAPGSLAVVSSFEFCAEPEHLVAVAVIMINVVMAITGPAFGQVAEDRRFQQVFRC